MDIRSSQLLVEHSIMNLLDESVCDKFVFKIYYAMQLISRQNKTNKREVMRITTAKKVCTTIGSQGKHDGLRLMNDERDEQQSIIV